MFSGRGRLEGFRTGKEVRRTGKEAAAKKKSRDKKIFSFRSKEGTEGGGVQLGTRETNEKRPMKGREKGKPHRKTKAQKKRRRHKASQTEEFLRA